MVGILADMVMERCEQQVIWQPIEKRSERLRIQEMKFEKDAARDKSRLYTNLKSRRRIV